MARMAARILWGGGEVNTAPATAAVSIPLPTKPARSRKHTLKWTLSILTKHWQSSYRAVTKNKVQTTPFITISLKVFGIDGNCTFVKDHQINFIKILVYKIIQLYQAEIIFPIVSNSIHNVTKYMFPSFKK